MFKRIPQVHIDMGTVKKNKKPRISALSQKSSSSDESNSYNIFCYC